MVVRKWPPETPKTLKPCLLVQFLVKSEGRSLTALELGVKMKASILPAPSVFRRLIREAVVPFIVANQPRSASVPTKFVLHIRASRERVSLTTNTGISERGTKRRAIRAGEAAHQKQETAHLNASINSLKPRYSSHWS